MSTKPKNILVFTDWYLPGYKAGGPIRSLANLIQTLTDVHFYVVTRNTDHFSSEPYPGIEANRWIKHSPNCDVFYFSEEKISRVEIEKIITERNCDKIYLNSLFSPKFTLLPLLAIRKLKLQHKCILAPRGMLKSGALSVKSKKKKLFLFLSKMTGLYRGIAWHATSTEEVKEIKAHFPNANPIRLAANLATPAGERKTKPVKVGGELRLVCIARISREKGIPEAIAFLKAAKLSGKVSCDFYGTIQDKGFLQQCKEEAAEIPNVSISFKGEIPPNEIPNLLNQYHFFYLPTLGENFGHAIAEALNSSTPVIISDRTPWRNLKERNAGWDIALDAASFSKALNECLQMDDSVYQSMCESAYRIALEVAADKNTLNAQYELFS